ncbi:hypothetical protein HDU97_008987 [Phlyctochytrium planicorne]|nr:hypothetical protein HDU97_008987 [Phlyctochytrium planicorne]
MGRPNYERLPTSDDDDISSAGSSPRHLTLSILPGSSSPKRAFPPSSSLHHDEVGALSPLERGHLIRLVGLPEQTSTAAPATVTPSIPTPSTKKDGKEDLLGSSPQNTAPSTSTSNNPAVIPIHNIADPLSEGSVSPSSSSSRPSQPTSPTAPLNFSGSFDELGRPIVDVIDSLNEDPFTLETFEELVTLHANHGKDFVIARVTTVDPDDENRFYYSYYAAHHINKVLFRTQPEEGLLHRMKARNPLNNMLIVGDVYYYAIRAVAVNLSRLCGSTAVRRTSTDSITSFLSSLSKTIKFAGDNIIAAASQQISSPQDDEELSSPRATSPLFGYDEKKRRRNITSPTGSFDDRMGSAVAARFAQKLKRILYVMSAGQMGESGVPKKKVLHVLVRPEALDETGKGNGAARRRSADDAFSDGKGKGKVVANEPGAERVLPKLAVAMRPTGAPLTSYRQVRSVSYINSTSGRTVQSLEEWMVEHSFQVSPSSPFRIQPSPQSPNTSKALGDVEMGTVSSSSKSSSLQVPPASHGKNKSKSKKQSPTTTSPRKSAEAPRLYYTAEFIGTDDDFLMKASVRMYFKEHALEAQNAVLFTIMGDTSPAEGEQHPALLNFGYAVSERDGEGEEDIWKVIGNRAIRMLVLVYIVLGFLLVKFVSKWSFLIVFLHSRNSLFYSALQFRQRILL